MKNITPIVGNRIYFTNVENSPLIVKNAKNIFENRKKMRKNFENKICYIKLKNWNRIIFTSEQNCQRNGKNR